MMKRMLMGLAVLALVNWAPIDQVAPGVGVEVVAAQEGCGYICVQTDGVGWCQWYEPAWGVVYCIQSYHGSIPRCWQFVFFCSGYAAVDPKVEPCAAEADRAEEAVGGFFSSEPLTDMYKRVERADIVLATRLSLKLADSHGGVSP